MALRCSVAEAARAPARVVVTLRWCSRCGATVRGTGPGAVEVDRVR